jgi:hypothetical protein
MRTLICLLVLWIGPAICAAEDEGLSSEERALILEEIAELVAKNYVFPDVAKGIRAELLDRLEDGRYDGLTDPAEFASELDADLLELSDDKHLGIGYDPNWAVEIRRQEDAGEEDVYLTDEMIEEERRRNFGFQSLRVFSGNVGYVDLRMFFDPRYAGETAVAAMSFLSNCDAIIFDLRDNGGGWGEMVAFLSSYFLFGEEAVLLNTNYYRLDDTYDQSWTFPYVPGPRMPEVPLYVLTSGYTFSAAEEFAYNLKHLDRATIVGETTRGGAHPVTVKSIRDRFVLYVPDAMSINPITGSNWEGVGVEPHIDAPAKDALDVAHLHALETLARGSTDEGERFRYQWHIDGLQAWLNPVTVDSSALRKYPGTYGSRVITLEDGVLYSRREDRPKQYLFPLDETTFGFEMWDDLRIRFVVEDGEVREALLLSDDGSEVRVPRE